MTTLTPRLAAKPANNGARPKLSRVTTESSAPRIVLNAVEGFGKTTFGAYAPNPAILMSRGETGYVTLKHAGRVPDADCIELTKWKDTLDILDDMADSFSNGALVMDATGGFERLCHEFVCSRDFGGDWSDKGFSSYMRGYDVAITDWIGLLTRLDKIRNAHNIPIILLSHSKIRPFKNPLGADFDRYIADCHEKTWGVTHKWADTVLFGTFVTVATEDKKSKRTKGTGGDDRVIYTVRRDAYDAKNRYGLPPAINLSTDPAAMWQTVIDMIQGKPAADEPPTE